MKEQNKDGFTLYELADRAAFSAFTASLNIDYKYKATLNRYDPIDEQLTATTKNNNIITYDIELKSRNFYYLPTDLIIEVSKYKGLMAYSNNIEKMYFNFIPNYNKLFIYDMNDFSAEELKSIYDPKFLCNEKTANGEKKKVEKEVYHLPIDKAKSFDFNSCKYYNHIYDYLNNKQKK